MSRDRQNLPEMLRELSRAMAGAFSESDAVARRLERLREEGYELQVTVTCSRLAPALAAAAPPSSLPADSHAAPVFRIDMQDLSFLRSIGIDPTRRLRRRKR